MASDNAPHYSSPAIAIDTSDQMRNRDGRFNHTRHLRNARTPSASALAKVPRMKSIRFVGQTLAIMIVMVATGASAEPVVSKLQAPVASAVKPVAGGAVFECLGDVCAARAPGADTASLRGCKDLARQVGSIVSFGPNGKPLASEQLTSCNSAARK